MSCIIHLDHCQEEYYPGANIKGWVICSLSDSINIREIRLKLRGREHTKWLKTKTKGRRVEYTGDNAFLSSTTSLAGSGEIGPGRLEYPFSFILPSKLPSSYDGKYGWIHYTIKATVDIPFARDYEGEISFKVVAFVDLNTRDHLILRPVSYSDDKMVCYWCCASGPITMNVHLEREAYVPGDSVKVKVEITNMSNENIEALEVKMEMTVEFKATSPTTDRKYDCELVATHNGSGVGAHSEKTYVFDLDIPQSTPVYNFDLCTLFDHWANLKVKAVLPDWHRDLKISARIDMGHIPVRVQGQLQNMNNQNSASPDSSQKNNQFPTEGVPYSIHEPPYSSSTNYPPVFPSLPSGGLPPLPPPTTSGSSIPSGPSAPPPEDVASAPPKAILSEEEHFSIVDVPNSSSGGETSALLPPPSYNEAVSRPQYLPK